MSTATKVIYDPSIVYTQPNLPTAVLSEEDRHFHYLPDKRVWITPTAKYHTEGSTAGLKDRVTGFMCYRRGPESGDLAFKLTTGIGGKPTMRLRTDGATYAGALRFNQVGEIPSLSFIGNAYSVWVVFSQFNTAQNCGLFSAGGTKIAAWLDTSRYLLIRHGASSDNVATSTAPIPAGNHIALIEYETATLRVRAWIDGVEIAFDDPVLPAPDMTGAGDLAFNTTEGVGHIGNIDFGSIVMSGTPLGDANKVRRAVMFKAIGDERGISVTI